MDIRSAYPHKYLKAADLVGQDVPVTIREVVLEQVDEDNPHEERPVCYFHEGSKGLVLNKTNGEMIAQMHGYETDLWRGKPITLYPDKTPFKGEVVDCIRVRYLGQAVSAVATSTAAPAPQTAVTAQSPQTPALGPTPGTAPAAAVETGKVVLP